MASSCSCIDTSELFAERSNCESKETGDHGVLHGETCYALTFGSSQCAAHDLGAVPRCAVEEEDTPEWCREEWCYVDPNACRLSTELVYKSTMFSDFYYSYSVCNATADNYLEYQTTESLRGVTLKATIPIIRDKTHFKRTPTGELATSTGPEYYNDTIPWQVPKYWVGLNGASS